MWSLARSVPLWGAVAIARRSQRCTACGAALALLAPAWLCRRNRGGVTLGRRSSLYCDRGSLFRRARRSVARTLCVWSLARSVPLRGRSRSRGAQGAAACGAALALLPPAWSFRRYCGGVTLDRRSSVAAARSLGTRSAARAVCVWSLARSVPLWGQSPSRGAHGAASCGAALALLAPASSCHSTHGGESLGRRSFVTAARSYSARSARRLALSACGRWRGRLVSGGSRRCAVLMAPLPAAQRWRSLRRLSRAAAFAAASSSAAALTRRRLALLARVALGGLRSLRSVLGAVASSPEAVAVARRSWRRCFRRRAGAPRAGSVLPPRSGGVSLGRRSSVAVARPLGSRSARRLAVSAGP